MISRLHSRFSRTLGPLILAGLLGACATQPNPSEAPAESSVVRTGKVVVDSVERAVDDFFNTAAWQQIPPRLRNQVEAIRLEYAVDFDATRAEIGSGELADLEQFLASVGAGSGDRVELDGPRPGGGYHDPLTAARLARVRGALQQLGLRPSVAERPLITPDAEANQIRVVITRVMVIPPDCNQPQPGRWERPVYDYGCSVTANLGRMVADPVDLDRGKVLAPADGEQATIGIQRYRADQVRPLIEESSQGE